VNRRSETHFGGTLLLRVTLRVEMMWMRSRVLFVNRCAMIN
jgi:hypothetical protein